MLTSSPLYPSPGTPGRRPRRDTYPATPAGTGRPVADAETPWARPPPASASASSAPKLRLSGPVSPSLGGGGGADRALAGVGRGAGSAGPASPLFEVETVNFLLGKKPSAPVRLAILVSASFLPRVPGTGAVLMAWGWGGGGAVLHQAEGREA